LILSEEDISFVCQSTSYSIWLTKETSILNWFTIQIAFAIVTMYADWILKTTNHLVLRKVVYICKTNPYKIIHPTKLNIYSEIVNCFFFLLFIYSTLFLDTSYWLLTDNMAHLLLEMYKFIRLLFKISHSLKSIVYLYPISLIKILEILRETLFYLKILNIF